MARGGPVRAARPGTGEPGAARVRLSADLPDRARGADFRIGNIAGAGLGLHDLLGIDTRLGAVISAAIAILIFSYQALDGVVDRAVIVLGVVKIG